VKNPGAVDGFNLTLYGRDLCCKQGNDGERYLSLGPFHDPFLVW
jgi:hypothetical protein